MSIFAECSGGAAFSKASRMAVSVMATGVMMVELRVTGASGGTVASVGRRSPKPHHFIAQAAPTIAMRPIAAPIPILRQCEGMLWIPVAPAAAL
jgi:hypothetical protein